MLSDTRLLLCIGFSRDTPEQAARKAPEMYDLAIVQDNQ